MGGLEGLEDNDLNSSNRVSLMDQNLDHRQVTSSDLLRFRNRYRKCIRYEFDKSFIILIAKKFFFDFSEEKFVDVFIT